MTVSDPSINNKPLPNTSSDSATPQRPRRPAPNRTKLTYDIIMLVVISIDLLLIGLDAILMSNFS